MLRVIAAAAPRSTVLFCEGRLTLATASQFSQAVDDVVRTKPAANVVISMREVSQIDSTGLGHLLGAYKKVAAAGGTLAISEPGSQPLTSLTLTNLNRILTPYPTLGDAIAAVEAA